MAGFRSITAYVPQESNSLGLGLAAEIFADRSHRGLPAFELTWCTDRPGTVRTDTGLRLHIEHGLDRLARGDLVLLLPGDSFHAEPGPEVLAAVRHAYDRGAIVASQCVGSYLLAATGLLDGRRATTHWRFAEDFARRFPRVNVMPESLYADEGRIITGAGAVAGIDLYLHIVRREHGSAVANAIAREIVVAPHRDGGQAQFIVTPVPDTGDFLAPVMTWALSNLDRPITVGDLAARTHMSPRTFARRFKDATGSTPHSWLLHQRLAQVEELLESTDLSIEEIARRVGYASATVLREQFQKRRGVAPRAYRRAFSARTG
ncbi:GlxA family transcriptional regulator [Allorhizocola rhizosphaerae]|uniref:GlxA family transcriptional regulator n=1 Tax=Allorhizocola rhizosphaerae TaxID=1872709 RepID=UPI000E3C9486|nr:helix-turn-helix domain-containing protein [Allorhizocola rhizosphaerae]